MADLTDAERADLTAKLQEAERRLHDLMTGKAVSQVASGGRSVTYQASRAGEVAELRGYISSLRRQLGMSGGRVCGRPYF
ncbi:MAG: hypothetical protein IH626_05425 [Rhodospirillales bacterium]|nr:hypothetical protein [Rhodospirillales bacterium]